jgi:isoquinoline 1-oxidoreductase beta subunit
MLVTAAAQTWDVPRTRCTTDKGEVIHQASGRRSKYGALVDKAAALPVPKTITLKDPKAFKLLGQSVPRLDLPEKVNGTAQFGIDVKLPGLLTARVVRCPVFGGKVASFNADKAKASPGVTHVVQISSGIAVVGDNYWAASQGAQALQVTWDEGPLATLTSAAMMKKVRRAGAAARQGGAQQRRTPTGARGGALVRASSSRRAFLGARVHGADELHGRRALPTAATSTCPQQGPDAVAPGGGGRVGPAGRQGQGSMSPTWAAGFGRRGEADFVTDAVETSKAIRPSGEGRVES